MKKQIGTLVLLLVAGLSGPWVARGKEKPPSEPPKPIGWAYVKASSSDFSGQTFDLHKSTRKIPQGSLLPVYKTKEKDGDSYGRVTSIDLDTGFPEVGWVKIDPAELRPPQAFPPDDDLTPLLGGAYLDDVVAKHTELARFLVHQSSGEELLVCYVLTAQLMMAKLVVFASANGKFVLEGVVNIPMAEAQNGITSLEIRDLVGDGNDCIISKENFRNLTDTAGTSLLIRRVVAGQLQTVWQAPIEYKNLSQYSAKPQILEPPEKNIGAPGTVTKGEVTYKPEGNRQTPVWKGKIEFFIVNREKPLDSVSIEKSCPWDGNQFSPVR